MAKLDKQGLNTFIRELDKHINTKINRLDVSPKADKVMMQDGTSVEESVSANKTSILNNTSLANQALTKANEAFLRGDNVKSQLVDKLISEGLNVSTNNTFEELISGIALGKKWASGNSTTVQDTFAGSGYRGFDVNVSNIGFVPSVIIGLTSEKVNYEGDNVCITVYLKEMSAYYKNANIAGVINRDTFSDGIYRSVTTKINSSTYRLYTRQSVNQPISWYAFE